MSTGDHDRIVPCSCLLEGNDDDHGDDNDDRQYLQLKRAYLLSTKQGEVSAADNTPHA